LKELQTDLSEEQGATQNRPSFKKFAQWVKMGGGRVRGVRKDITERRAGRIVVIFLVVFPNSFSRCKLSQGC
jgi:hypothetical protein